MTKVHLLAEFRTHRTAADAVRDLAAAGVPTGSMELYSRQPVEAGPTLLPRKSRMSLGAVLGAIAAGTAATALMFRIQLSYPLVTGGMPIISGWATAVVTFEAAMAGAVLATALLMARDAGLGPWRARAPVPELPDEGVILQVDCSRGLDPDDIRDILFQAGAVRVDAASPVSA